MVFEGEEILQNPGISQLRVANNVFQEISQIFLLASNVLRARL